GRLRAERRRRLVEEAARERLRQTGDDLAIALVQMSELRERSVELSPAQNVRARVQRGDDGCGIACRAFFNESRRGDSARLFAFGDDLGRYGRFEPEIVDAPIQEPADLACIRGEASRHRDIDDDQRTSCDARAEELSGE